MSARGAFTVSGDHWRGQGRGGSPFAALMHAVLATRDLAEGQRAAMRRRFDHLVFAPDVRCAVQHVPPAVRGVLGPLGAVRDRSIRRYLQRTLATLD